MSNRLISIDNIDPEEPSGLSYLARVRAGGAPLSASVVADTFDDEADADVGFDENGDEDGSDAESSSWVDSTSELVRVDPDGSDAIPSLEAFAAFKHLARSAYSAYLASSREERDTDDAPAPHPTALSRFVSTVFPPEAPSIASPNLSVHSLSGSHSRSSGAVPVSAGDRAHAHVPASATAGPASSGSSPNPDGAAAVGVSPPFSASAVPAAPGSLSITLPSLSSGSSNPAHSHHGGKSLSEAIAIADAGYTSVLASRFASEVPLLLLQQAFALAPAPGAASASSLAPEPAAGVAVLTYDLILALVDAGHVSQAHVLRALMRTQDDLPDLMLDAPAAPALIDATTDFFADADTLTPREAEYLHARTRLAVALLPPAAHKHAFWPAPTQSLASAALSKGIAAAKRVISLGIQDSLDAGTVTVAAAGIADTAAAAEHAYRSSLPAGTAPTGAEVAVLRDWIGFESAKLLVRAQVEAQTRAKQRFVRKALAAVAGGREEVARLSQRGGSGTHAEPMTPLAVDNMDKLSSLAAETAAKRAGTSGTRIVIAATEAERAFAFLLLRYDDLVLDVIHAEIPLSSALVGAVKDEVISPVFLGKISGIAPDSGRAGPGRVVERARRALLAKGKAAAEVDGGDDDGSEGEDEQQV